MILHFTKMQGLGNDFIVIDGRNLSHIDWTSLSSKLLDRRYGIGADQLLILEDSQKADFRMRIFNPDGSEVEMCGNGIRCLANYIWKRSLSTKSPLEIETLAGVIRPEKVSGEKNLVRVNMGRPGLRPEDIPVNIASGESNSSGSSLVLDYPLQVRDRLFHITCVSMGNPHAVIMEEDLEGLDIRTYGPLIENHPLFPKRTNVEFVKKVSENTFLVRVWERGAGETLACGTGASAVAVAMKIKGLGGDRQKIILPGGELFIELQYESGAKETLKGIEAPSVFMTGPAEEVFRGEIDLLVTK
jgi:diaminopimelate epimerase